MAGEDGKTKFILDLDVKEFTEKGLHAKGIIESIGDSKNMTGLTEGLLKATPFLAAAGAAAYGLKKALDFTLEAEQIKRVENQFMNLSTQAGISGKALKAGLESASGGLITTGELLESASKSVVGLGDNAKRLPEILELARKATSVYGGDAKKAFEDISQALSVGNTKALKQYGIVVDNKKAIDDYAKSLGVASNELSANAQRQALFNAGMEQAQARFKDVTTDGQEAKEAITLITNNLSEMRETFVLAFDRTLGPSIKSAIGYVSELSAKLRASVMVNFGDEAEQTAGKVKQLELTIKDLEGSIAAINAQSKMNPMRALFGESAIASAQKKIEEYKVQLAELKQIQVQEDAESQARIDKTAAENERLKEQELIDQEERLKNNAKFQADLQAISKATLDFEKRNVKSLADIEKVMAASRVAIEEEHQAKVAAIQVKYANDEKKREAMLAAEKKRYMQEELAFEKSSYDQRKSLLDQYSKNATGAAESFKSAFAAAAEKGKHDMEDWSRHSKNALQDMSAIGVQSFQGIGAALVNSSEKGKDALKIMAGAFMGVIGDRAIAEGTLMLTTGIATPNPLWIAGGGALLTLGGALKALASTANASVGASPPSAPSVSSGGGGVSPTTVKANNQYEITKQKDVKEYRTSRDEEDYNYSSSRSSASDFVPVSETKQPDIQNNAEQMERRQRAVSVNISGNYFETESTRRQLMEMIRAESDATDFQYNKLGV